ncbi:hypothetical protein ON010_g12841 [Phytophthora cinnamomi]|nr:hypothetical protein ON010_g12841 [Phytophthora cinnamomi]
MLSLLLVYKRPSSRRRAFWGDVLALTYPSNEWLSATDVDEKVAAQPLTALSSVAASKVPFASSAESVSAASKAAGKRRSYAEVSRETKTAWQIMFPSAFEARHGVRDHVTDLVTVTKWERLTPEDYSRNVFHVEMDTTNTAIKYRIVPAVVQRGARGVGGAASGAQEEEGRGCVGPERGDLDVLPALLARAGHLRPSVQEVLPGPAGARLGREGEDDAGGPAGRRWQGRVQAPCGRDGDVRGVARGVPVGPPDAGRLAHARAAHQAAPLLYCVEHEDEPDERAPADRGARLDHPERQVPHRPGDSLPVGCQGRPEAVGVRVLVGDEAAGEPGGPDRDGRSGNGYGSVPRVHPGARVPALAGRQGGSGGAVLRQSPQGQGVPVRRRVGRVRGRRPGDVPALRVLARPGAQGVHPGQDRGGQRDPSGLAAAAERPLLPLRSDVARGRRARGVGELVHAGGRSGPSPGERDDRAYARGGPLRAGGVLSALSRIRALL